MKTTTTEATTPRAPQRAARTAKATDGNTRCGTLEWRRGKARLRLSLGSFGRRMLALSTCRTEAEAEERRALLVPLAEKLVASGQAAIGFPLLQNAAKRNGAALDAIVKAIERLAKGEARPRATGEMTIRELARQWTSGELAKLYPGQVREKTSADDDEQRIAAYVLPIVGDIPVARFTLDHAEEIMRRVPSDRAPPTRRQIAQTVHRLIVLAVYPLRLLAANPLPRGFLPKVGPAKAKSYLYPDEERKLLGCTAIVLVRRVLYAFLSREGMRAGEAAGLTWADLDLVRGAVRLDTNKTDDPRAWTLRRDVLRALVAWRGIERAEGRGRDGYPVFPVTLACAATRFRENLERAGITRPELFERSKARQPIRVHDLRATFVTIALATGKNEAWIQDRTGHRSSAMINLYRRVARHVSELDLGDLAPMDTAIPELAPAATPPADASGPDASPAPADAGTPLVPPAPGVASRREKPYKTSDSAHAETPGWPSKSAIRKGVRVQVPSSAPRGNPSGFEGAKETGAEGAPEGPYQIRTSAPDTAAREEAARPAVTGRAATIVRFAGELASLVAGGDLEAARDVHETIGRLLALAMRAGEDAAPRAVVVDLEAERERRAGRL